MLHQDYSQRVVLNTQDMEWEESYAPGVSRKKLEREAAESGRATSIVRYHQGATFPTHKHNGGEEIYVLEGIFSDETGDYPAGTYFRNPIGTSHAPFSEQGCTIFVKLCYFDENDTEQLAITTQDQPWHPGLVEGLEVLPLHSHESEHTALVRWQPGTRFKPHQHWGGEEILVLQGEFHDEHGAYPAGTWIRSPHLSLHSPYVEDKLTVLLVKTGHLGRLIDLSQN